MTVQAMGVFLTELKSTLAKSNLKGSADAIRVLDETPREDVSSDSFIAMIVDTAEWCEYAGFCDVGTLIKQQLAARGLV